MCQLKIKIKESSVNYKFNKVFSTREHTIKFQFIKHIKT